MTGSEIVGLVASLVSLVISGFAIWLSVVFYKLSTKNAQDLEKASSAIASTVTRLEVLFDKLYTDTFSMMRDTVTDMRKHVWKTYDGSSLESPGGDIEASFEALKVELNGKIEELLKSQGSTNHAVSSFAEKVEILVEEAVAKTATSRMKATRREKDVAIIRALEHNGPAKESELRALTGLSESEIASLIFRLGQEGTIVWEGGPYMFHSDSIFRLPGA